MHNTLPEIITESSLSEILDVQVSSSVSYFALPMRSAGNERLTLCRHIPMAKLEARLAMPMRAYIEITPDAEETRQLCTFARSYPGMMISFSCTVFAQLPIARMVMRLLSYHVPMSQAVYDNITTAIHEAATNALIHGNLRVQSGFSDIAGYTDYYKLYHERLNNTIFSHQRINIFLCWDKTHIIVTVEDKSQERKIPLTPPRGSLDLPYGRGLKIISSLAENVTISAFSNAIRMRFRYNTSGYTARV